MLFDFWAEVYEYTSLTSFVGMCTLAVGQSSGVHPELCCSLLFSFSFFNLFHEQKKVLSWPVVTIVCRITMHCGPVG